MTRTALTRLGLAVAFAALTAAPAGLNAATPLSPDAWKIDKAHSRVTFTVTKWGFAEVEGRFLDFEGAILYVAQHPQQSRIEWRLRIASVQTGAPSRDKALQGAEYFDADRFPEMQFVSEHVRSIGPNQLEVQGQMTIKGQARSLTVRVLYGGSHPVPKEGAYEIFQTEFAVNRHDYGVVGGSLWVRRSLKKCASS